MGLAVLDMTAKRSNSNAAGRSGMLQPAHRGGRRFSLL